MTLNFDGTMLVVGAGKMGAALLEGFLANGLAPGHVAVQDPAPSAEIKTRLAAHGVTVSPDAGAQLKKPPDLLLLAVKPQMMTEVVKSLSGVVGGSTLVLSVLAGQPLAALESGLNATQPVIRAMPNTPASIGAGMTVCVANRAVTEAHKSHADALFSCVGDVAWIDDETLMDAVTGVSGSGPAYIFLVAEVLAQAGVAAGLEANLADRLARATVSGAGRLLEASDQSAAELREAVTSPGGTTAAALDVLNDGSALKVLFERAVAAAKKRGQDLAG